MQRDEDYAYETQRQRELDSDWTKAEDEAAEELSFRPDQQLKETEATWLTFKVRPARLLS